MEIDHIEITGDDLNPKIVIRDKRLNESVAMSLQQCEAVIACMKSEIKRIEKVQERYEWNSKMDEQRRLKEPL